MRNALQAGWNPINIRLGDGQLLGADAEEFVIPQGFDLRFAGSHHGEGISHRIEDLQLEKGSVPRIDAFCSRSPSCHFCFALMPVGTSAFRARAFFRVL